MAIGTKNASPANAPASAANTKNAMAGRPPPPAMLHHTPKEFHFAQRILHKLVLNSDFFPQRAEEDDWFQSQDEVDARIRSDRREAKQSLKKKQGGRRPSDSSSECTASTATASLASSSYSGGSPLVRRSTINMDIMIDVDSLGGLTLDPVRGGAVDTTSGLPITLTRRASLDNAALWVGTNKKATMVVDYSKKEEAANGSSSASAIKKTKEGGTDKEYEYSPVPSIHEHEVDYGGILGTGGFCEVRLVTLRKDKRSKRSDELYAMKYLSPTKFAPIEQYGDNSVKPPSRNKKFERGIADLAIEARFLTLLSHENIISLHYVGQGSLEEQFNCCQQGENENDSYHHQFGYFLLLDPLYESLAQRIEGRYIPGVFDFDDRSPEVEAVPQRRRSGSWWKKMMHHKNSSSSIQDPLLDSWKMQLAQRLEGLRGVASALQYLHDECRVIYRDVKPDNIGFYRKPHANCHCGKRSWEQGRNQSSSPFKQECTCYDEIPKLFDFGLCKELKPKYLKAHPNDDPSHEVDTYKLTARSGSRRYMSPEVAFCEPYNEKADVYSLGIVLYQVASLVTPFEGFSLLRHEEEILAWGDRPNAKIPSPKKALIKVKKSNVSYKRWSSEEDLNKRNKHLALRTKCVWTRELQRLIEECWHGDLRARPGMKDVVRSLDDCIHELTSNVR